MPSWEKKTNKKYFTIFKNTNCYACDIFLFSKFTLFCFVELWESTPWHKNTCHQFLRYSILKQQWVLDSKKYSEWEHLFYNIRCPCCEAERTKATRIVGGKLGLQLVFKIIINDNTWIAICLYLFYVIKLLILFLT